MWLMVSVPKSKDEGERIKVKTNNAALRMLIG
jgi:hypothetical protein